MSLSLNFVLSLSMTGITAPGFGTQGPPQVAASPSPNGVEGQVLDAGSKSPVIRAEVALVGADVKVSTDQDGRFSIPSIRPGVYSLRISRVGYEALVKENVAVPSGTTMRLALEIKRIVTLLEDITVTPGAFAFMETGSSARQTMSREDIETVPQLGEDIFRAVNRLPGLSSGDYSAHFSIRGGRHDETLILFDGLELHEPYHLKDFNEGAISIIDTQTIDGVELLTGGFPAQYGNKRSGVMNISSRTPESDKAHFSAGISFLNARAMGQGPLWDGKGSWLMSARSGYMGLVFSLIKQNELPSPQYQDIFAKAQRTLGTSHVWTLNVLHARDTYTFDHPTTTGFEDSLRTREHANNRYGNSYAWSTLTSSLGSKVTMRTQLSGSLVTRSRDGSELYVDFNNKPLYSLTNQRDYGILGAKQDWRFRAADSFILDGGIDIRRLSNTDTFQNIVNEDPNDPLVNKAGYPLTLNTRFQKSGSRVGLYVSNKWRAAKALTFEFGGRYDRASYTEDRDFSPRAAAAVDLGHRLTLRAGWGRYRQIQGLDEIAALNAGRFYKSELSRQWTVGLERTFSRGTLFRIEGYLKDGSHLRPLYRNWKNAPDTFPETNEDRILVFPKTSRARGLEAYFAREFGARLTMSASYALSVAEDRVDRIHNVNAPFPIVFDSKLPGVQDQRHAAHLDLTYRLSKWSINASLAYHSGWPGTLESLVSVLDADGDRVSALRPQELYGTRLPSYLRLDTRVTRKWKNWRGFLELVNLTNHANVFGYDYYRTREAGNRIGFARNDEKWFTILPSIGISWSRSK